MSGFSVVNSPAVPAGPLITNDGWFPDVDPAAFIGTRIRDSITPQQRRDALVAAIITVGNDLDAWARMQRASGYAALAEVPAKKIDGTSRLVLLYTRAVFSTAKADLIEGYRDVDLTGAGQRKMEEIEPASGELRREALYAIRDILGVGRVTVELI
jgi:hypothetical protein